VNTDFVTREVYKWAGQFETVWDHPIVTASRLSL